MKYPGYVDHPSFAMAILARVLESAGFRVGKVAKTATCVCCGSRHRHGMVDGSIVEVPLIIPGNTVGLGISGRIHRLHGDRVLPRFGLPGEIPPCPGASNVWLPQAGLLPGPALIQTVCHPGDLAKRRLGAPFDQQEPRPQWRALGEF